MKNAFPSDTQFFGLTRQPIKAGSWVIVYRGLRENSLLVASFLWKVVAEPDGSLALQARDLDVQFQVQLTTDLARRCTPIEPASMLRLEDHPAEWRRWRAAGWDVYLTTAINGDLMVCSQKGNSSAIVTFSTEEIQDMQREPECGKRVLMEALYYQVHPRKAKAFAESEQRIPADELAHFIRRYERQEKVGGKEDT